MRDKEEIVQRIDDAGNKGAEWWDVRWAASHEHGRWPRVENGLGGNVVAGKNVGAFVILYPKKWADFVVQFGNGRPVEVAKVPFCKEVGCKLKWLRGCESVYPSFFERGGADGLIQLTVTVVRVVEWLEWGKSQRVWGQIGGMLFVGALGVVYKLESIERAGEGLSDAPGAGELVL